MWPKRGAACGERTMSAPLREVGLSKSELACREGQYSRKCTLVQVAFLDSAPVDVAVENTIRCLAD
jgi:hypothetical protein